MNSGHIFRLE